MIDRFIVIISFIEKEIYNISGLTEQNKRDIEKLLTKIDNQEKIRIIKTLKEPISRV